MSARWRGLVLVLVVLAAACSSKRTHSTGSNGSGSGASCSDFCQHLLAGDHCEELDVSQCESSCEQTTNACPSRATDLLECLTDLRITCTAPGYAVGYGADAADGGAEPAVATLTSGPGTIEVHDDACAKIVAEFQSCPSGAGPAGACDGWRQTSECSGYGPREDYNDKTCDVSIEPGWSGFCACADREVHVDCGHAAATCAQVCEVGSF